MSSNLDSRTSSVRDIAKLFPEDKRLGTKASDLVSGAALTVCLDIDEAFEVLRKKCGGRCTTGATCSE